MAGTIDRKAIRLLLAVKGWSQDRLAVEAGLSPSTVSRFLLGYRTSPRIVQMVLRVLTDEPADDRGAPS